MSRNPAYDKLLSDMKMYLQGDENHGFGEAPQEDIAAKYVGLLDRMLAVYEAKDTDYSENDLPMGNMREAAALGIAPWKGVLLRIGDKKRRIGSFVKRANYLVKDEGVDDTLVDMANYALLGLVLWMEPYSGEGDNIAFADWSKIHAAWLNMAYSALRSKMLFEYKDTPGVEAWYADVLTSVNISYDQLAAFSCNNNDM